MSSPQALPSWARIPLNPNLSAVAEGVSRIRVLPPVSDATAGTTTPAPESVLGNKSFNSSNPVHPSISNGTASISINPVTSAAPISPGRFDYKISSRDTLFLQEQHALALQYMQKEIESLRTENKGDRRPLVHILCSIED